MAVYNGDYFIIKCILLNFGHFEIVVIRSISST